MQIQRVCEFQSCHLERDSVLLHFDRPVVVGVPDVYVYFIGFSLGEPFLGRFLIFCPMLCIGIRNVLFRAQVNHVSIVCPELSAQRKVDSLILPAYIPSVYLYDMISARSAVLCNVDAWGEISADPPCGAYGAGIMLISVLVLYVPHEVGVCREHMGLLVGVQERVQLFSVVQVESA